MMQELTLWTGLQVSEIRHSTGACMSFGKQAWLNLVSIMFLIKWLNNIMWTLRFCLFASISYPFEMLLRS